MATAYLRLRMFWGALDLDLEEARSPGYGATQIVSGGESAAVASGVGVRRATLVCDRSSQNTLMDPALCHFDFLNTTSGAPDDTWITSDYSTSETNIQAWMTALKAYMPTPYKWTQIIWHRVGTGVGKPNPAERTLTIGTPIVGTGGAAVCIPQSATSITFKTGLRKNWGRTYFPGLQNVDATGVLPSATVDAICTATNTLVTSQATADFHLVVVSSSLSSSLNVEQIQVDNVVDVIRRRRIKKKTYAKVLP